MPVPVVRFLLRERTGGWLQSPIGRTRTAPSPEADVPIKVAIINCQDYVGRYYNTLLPLLSAAHDDIDVLVHLGDIGTASPQRRSNCLASSSYPTTAF
jgi:alkaline phosphatase D